MNALNLVRFALDLPARRNAATVDSTWVEMADGVRLATSVFRPVGEPRVPAVLLRTPYGRGSWRTPIFLMARLFAEAGMAAVLQDVRGRYDSEGRFTPFVNEGADGGRAIDWVLEQPWCNGRLGLCGFSYLAYSAWAALERRPDRVTALAAGIGASDVWSTFYPGGAFALELALRWSSGVGERENVPERRVDLDRGLRFRPLREADRVALRERPFYRDWLDHPRRDAYWDGFRPEVRRAPPTLLLSGWYDLFLGPQLADYAALRASPEAASPRLVVGPWTHGRYQRRRRSPRSRWFGHVAAREMLGFFERHLLERGGANAKPGARILALGEEHWRDFDAWPPDGASAQRLHLRSGGRANGLGGDGRLDPEAPDGAEPPDRFTYDPADPVPSCGGALIGPGGAMDQRGVEARSDVLVFDGLPLGRDQLLAGPVRCTLFAASSAPDTDFTAKLVQVAPDGRATNLCEGVTRSRWRQGGAEPAWLEPETPARIEIDLWSVAARVPAGHRLRLEISSSSFPRFDRNPNTRDEIATTAGGVPARQTVLHDAEHASSLELHVLPDA